MTYFLLLLWYLLLLYVIKNEEEAEGGGGICEGKDILREYYHGSMITGCIGIKFFFVAVVIQLSLRESKRENVKEK